MLNLFSEDLAAFSKVDSTNTIWGLLIKLENKL